MLSQCELGQLVKFLRGERYLTGIRFPIVKQNTGQKSSFQKRFILHNEEIQSLGQLIIILEVSLRFLHKRRLELFNLIS